jgi:multicomponent Na+:H+ antiporter subunit G
MTAIEWVTVGLALAGVALLLLSSAGVVRLPDTYTRLHAAGISYTLGLALVLLSVAVYLGTLSALLRLLGLWGLLLLVLPFSGHIIARTAYLSGARRANTTHIDNLADAYDPETRQLR